MHGHACRVEVLAVQLRLSGALLPRFRDTVGCLTSSSTCMMVAHGGTARTVRAMFLCGHACPAEALAMQAVLRMVPGEMHVLQRPWPCKLCAEWCPAVQTRSKAHYHGQSTTGSTRRAWQGMLETAPSQNPQDEQPSIPAAEKHRSQGKTHMHTQSHTHIHTICLCIAAKEQHPEALALTGAAWVPLKTLIPMSLYRTRLRFEGLPLHRVPRCALLLTYILGTLRRAMLLIVDTPRSEHRWLSTDIRRSRVGSQLWPDLGTALAVLFAGSSVSCP
eukprot:scaffold62211_cov18-Tisochrysis_lutea.AAC.1